jgi:SpoVK/Ycf46/Vps4 family AAA+-type ATPase
MLEKLLLGAAQAPRRPEVPSPEPPAAAAAATAPAASKPLRPQAGQPPAQPPAPPHPIDAHEVDLAGTAKATVGFSGSDVRLLCKEAAMKPVRWKGSRGRRSARTRMKDTCTRTHVYTSFY